MRWSRRNRRQAALLGLVAGLLCVLTLGSILAASAFHASEQKALAAQKKSVESERNAKTSQAETLAVNERMLWQSYVADINLAQRFLEENNAGDARRLLARHEDPREAMMRGPEWDYLRNQCSDTDLAIPVTDGWVTGVRFTNSEKNVVTVALDRLPQGDGRSQRIGFRGQLNCWDRQTGRSTSDPLLNQIAASSPESYKAVTSRGCSCIGIALRDGSFEIYDSRGVVTRLHRVIRDSSAEVRMSDDGVRLAVKHRPLDSVSTDPVGVIDIWDVPAKRILGTINNLAQDASQSFAFDHQGRYVAIGDENRAQVRLWKIDEEFQEVAIAWFDRIRAMEFRPGYHQLAVSGYRRLALLDVANMEERINRPLEAAVALTAKFSDDGRLLATGGIEGLVEVIDIEENRVVRRVRAHENPVSSLDFSSDSAWLATGGLDGKLRIIRVASSENEALESPDPRGLPLLRIAPTGGLVAVGYRTGPLRSAAVWNVAQKTRVGPSIELSSPLAEIQWSRNGAFVAFNEIAGDVVIVDTREEIPEPRHIVAGRFAKTALNSSGTMLAIADASGHVTIKSYKGDDNSVVLGTIEERVLSMAFSPDDRQLVCCEVSGRVVSWDLPNSSQKTLAQLPMWRSWMIAFSDDSDKLAVCAADQSIKGVIWILDSQSGRIISELKGPMGDWLFGSFSPDGQRFAAGGGDGIVRMWDVEHGELLLSLGGNEQIVQCVQFLPVGPSLVSIDESLVVRRWNMAPCVGRKE
ncbi:MAG: WD40 repeat domain-containing protein [Planctomycetota bacterium]|nr:WD40 repeat domain-containing protein [Planctomycetota bacterium]